MAPPLRTLDDRLWSKVHKEGPVPGHRPELGPCWPSNAQISERRRNAKEVPPGVTVTVGETGYSVRPYQAVDQ